MFTARDFINNSIPKLRLTDAVKTAQEIVDALNISFLPVTDGDKFLGLLPETAIFEAKPKALISQFQHDFLQVNVSESDHYFEILKKCAVNKSTVVAVLDEDGLYIGSSWIIDIGQHMGQSYFVEFGGAVMVLSMFEKQYSLAEIARLVEGNDAKILAVLADTMPEEPNRLLVTLKINQTDLSRIVATFERFSYEVVQVFHQTNFYNTDIDRLNLLLKIINM